MNQSSDAAEQIVRMSLEGVEVAAKITGTGAKNVAAIIYTIMNDKQKTAGKIKLSNMLKSGKELKVFSIKQEELKKFQEEAKRYGVLYCALIDRKNKTNDGVVDIMARAEDAAKINRIVERFKLSSYNKVEIINDIEKTKNEREEKNLGREKENTQRIKEKEIKEKPIQKDKNSLNPKLGKTEKSPLLKPTLKDKSFLEQEGSDLYKKESVKVKLNKYQETIKNKSDKDSRNINDNNYKKNNKIPRREKNVSKKEKNVSIR